MRPGSQVLARVRGMDRDGLLRQDLDIDGLELEQAGEVGEELRAAVVVDRVPLMARQGLAVHVPVADAERQDVCARQHGSVEE